VRIRIKKPTTERLEFGSMGRGHVAGANGRTGAHCLVSLKYLTGRTFILFFSTKTIHTHTHTKAFYYSRIIIALWTISISRKSRTGSEMSKLCTCSVRTNERFPCFLLIRIITRYSPVCNCTAERAFSKLARVKNRSSLLRHNLSSLIFQTTENDVLQNIRYNVIIILHEWFQLRTVILWLLTQI